ncbi:GSCOCG00001241001-RA-CDS [Cotesia congregata]|nr:GSCOCG00001241001-RA-CDS [Cotesia congregata]
MEFFHRELAEPEYRDEKPFLFLYFIILFFVLFYFKYFSAPTRAVSGFRFIIIIIIVVVIIFSKAELIDTLSVARERDDATSTMVYCTPGTKYNIRADRRLS